MIWQAILAASLHFLLCVLIYLQDSVILTRHCTFEAHFFIILFPAIFRPVSSLFCHFSSLALREADSVYAFLTKRPTVHADSTDIQDAVDTAGNYRLLLLLLLLTVLPPFSFHTPSSFHLSLSSLSLPLAFILSFLLHHSLTHPHLPLQLWPCPPLRMQFTPPKTSALPTKRCSSMVSTYTCTHILNVLEPMLKCSEAVAFLCFFSIA